MDKYFKGVPYQRGFGCGAYNFKPGQYGGFSLGSIASKFWGFISPYLTKIKDAAVPSLKSGAKAVGNELIKSASEIAKDVIRGKNIQESATARVDTDKLKEIALQKGDEMIENVRGALQDGQGYKRKRIATFSNPFNKRKKKKKVYNDIFS